MTEADIRVMRLQTKEPQGLPATPEVGKDPPLETAGRAQC